MKAKTAGKLNTYPQRLENGAVLGLLQAGWELAKEAAYLAPVDTGLLQSGVTYTEPEIVAPLHVRNAVGPQVYYGRYQELGTSKMAAQPYLRPALKRKRPELVAIIVHGTLRGID